MFELNFEGTIPLVLNYRYEQVVGLVVGRVVDGQFRVEIVFDPENTLTIAEMFKGQYPVAMSFITLPYMQEKPNSVSIETKKEK